MLGPDSFVRFGHVSDGLSNTMMIGEQGRRLAATRWMSYSGSSPVTTLAPNRARLAPVG